MLSITLHALRKARGQVLGWGISLGIFGLFLVALYDTIAAQRAGYEALVESFSDMLAFFGGVTDLFSPSGYITLYFFSYIPLVAGVYAVLAGSSMLVGDEESGTLDLVLAHPISRTRLLMGRYLALALTLVGICAIAWLGFVLPMPATMLDIGPGSMALPFVSMFALLMTYGSLALLLSMVLPSRDLAASVAGLLLVAGYALTSLASLDERLEAVERFSPFHYYQSGEAIGGLEWGSLGVLLGVTLLFMLLAWALFQRRDIRVGGEGGWRLPGRRARQAPAQR